MSHQDPSHQIDPNLLDTGGYSLEASLSGFDYANPLDTPADTPDLGGGTGSKRKNGGKDGDSPAQKRTRQSQSCDACRARKVKCDRPPPGSAAAMSAPRDICSHCDQLNLPCTFEYKPKKRGPPNLYLRKMRTGDLDDSSIDGSPRTSRDTKPYQYDMPSVPSYDRRQSGLSGGGTLASLNSMQASALSTQGEGVGASMGRHVDEAWDDALVQSVAVHAAMDASGGHYQSGGHLGPPPPLGPVTAHLSSSPSTSFASPPYVGLPHNPSNPLERVIPRGLLYHIVDLFFDYVYPLTPCLHKPTFMRDLHEKREERPGQEEFTHMVYSLVSSTLTQIPRSFVAMPRREVHGLIERCYGLCRAYMSRDFTELSIDRMVMMYFTTLTAAITRGTLRGSVSAMIFGAHCASLTTLGLCDERTYQAMDPISRELHRRIFWLAYGADRSSSAVEGTPLIFNEVDCGDVALPSDIDDEYLTQDAYLDQPDGKTPILSGFYYISQLWRYTAQLMEKRRLDRRSTPHGVLLQIRLNEVDELHERVMGLMDDCPEVLKLDFDTTASMPYVPISSRLCPSRPGPSGVRAVPVQCGPLLPCPCPAQSRPQPKSPLHSQGPIPAPVPPHIQLQSPLSMQPHSTHPLLAPSQVRAQLLAQAQGRVARVEAKRDGRCEVRRCTEERLEETNGERKRTENKSQRRRSLSPDWDAHASADIRSLFLDPKSSKAVAKDAYLVQQANIYVSQQMTRLMILQYRDELHSLQAEEIAKSASPVRDPRDRRYSNTRKLGKEAFSEEEKEQVMIDLLVILQRIPIQVIAVNSLPLVSKVRMIASTLLDSIDNNGAPIPPEQRGSTERKQRAQTYLWDFLKILSEIESMYSMNEGDGQGGAA